MAQFMKFPSIEQFHNLMKFVEIRPHLVPAKITYVGKIKLHGTNAAVVIDPKHDKIQAQKRTSMVTPEADNFGFASWVESNMDVWRELIPFVKKKQDNESPVYIYGEWCGPGIQNNVALSQIPKKQFVVFAVGYHEDGDEDKFILETSPSKILTEWVIPVFEEIEDMKLAQNHLTVEMNLFNREDLVKKVQLINDMVDVVEECDPFVKQYFGVEGIGEGLVFYPIVDGKTAMDRDFFSRFAFKSKGEKHAAKGNTKGNSTQLTPEQITSNNEFVKKFVTEDRLVKIVQEYLDNDFDTKRTGDFLKHFMSDVAKESKDELEESGLEWKIVTKPVQTAARNWFIRECKMVV